MSDNLTREDRLRIAALDAAARCADRFPGRLTEYAEGLLDWLKEGE